jgi:hypothetical protein
MPTMPPASAIPASAPAFAAAEAPVAIASLAQVAPQEHAATHAKEEKKKSNVAPLIFGGLVAAAAVAAGGFFLLAKTHIPANTAAGASVAGNGPAPNVEAVPAATAAEPVVVAENTAAPEPTLDPNALPAAQAAKPSAAKVAVKGTAAKVATKEGAETKEESAKLSSKDLPSTPAGPAGALGDEMRKVVGDKGTAQQTPAAGAAGPQFAPGSVPQKPSQGAVTGAIGVVMHQARECLGPDDPVSHASIVFGSAGTVQSVSVSGHAAGKPAEACIKTALSQAKVSPFAEPTFTARVTVRGH